MIKKRPAVFLALLGLLGFPLHASMISILVIETCLQQETVVDEYSSLWEDGLMGVFFDAGHIVTNGTIMRLDKNPLKEFPDEAQADFHEASEGGAEYYVLALLEYKNQDGTIKPAGISIRLYSMVPRKLIYEQRFPAGQSADLKEEYAHANQAARALISHLKDR
jgi:hypothetical protein